MYFIFLWHVKNIDVIYFCRNIFRKFCEFHSSSISNIFKFYTYSNEKNQSLYIQLFPCLTIQGYSKLSGQNISSNQLYEIKRISSRKIRSQFTFVRQNCRTFLSNLKLNFLSKPQG